MDFAGANQKIGFVKFPGTVLALGAIAYSEGKPVRSISINYYQLGEKLMLKYRTTVGWSLLTSGIVTLFLKIFPGDSLWWGIGFLILGILVLVVRKS